MMAPRAWVQPARSPDHSIACAASDTATCSVTHDGSCLLAWMASSPR